MNGSKRLAFVTTGVVAALLLGACGEGAGQGGGSALPPAPDGPLRLRGVCPDRVVIQTDWAPEAEHGGSYQLLGPDPVVDTDHKRVSGTLVAEGRDTGVKVEIRAGGPAIGFQTVSSQMYLDPGITLGQVTTDEAVSLSANQPTIAVVAPLNISPQIVMWDPGSHPGWHTIADIGRADTKVLYFQTAAFMEYLIGAGLLHREQVDGSFDGSPAAFVASGGTIAQQGFATSEPYLFEKGLPRWGKPVNFQLINDTGYPVYPEALSARSGEKTALAPCLKRLVPIIQRAELAYLRAPENTNRLITDLAGKYNVGQSYTMELAKFSTEQQLRLHIVGNGQGNTLGGFDQARIERVIQILTPILAAQQKAVRVGLTPADIATTEFVDPTIGLAP